MSFRNSSQRSGNSNTNDDYLHNCDPIIRLGSPRWFESLRQEDSVPGDASGQSKTSTTQAKKTKGILFILCTPFTFYEITIGYFSVQTPMEL